MGFSDRYGIYVESGWFEMGSNDGEADENRGHRVFVKPLYMDKYEVTVKKFKQFIDAIGYRTDAEKEGWSYVWTGRTWDNALVPIGDAMKKEKQYKLLI